MTPPPLSLDVGTCRKRQQRLVEVLRTRNIDRAVLVQPENVHYLTGYRPPFRLLGTAACLDGDGWCGLVAASEVPEHAAADKVVTFEAQLLSTVRQEQVANVAAAAGDLLQARATCGRAGAELSVFGPPYADAVGVGDLARIVDIEADLWRLRRKKDADELAMIRRAIACTDVMYSRAKEIIRPGITELQVFNELQAAAVDEAGEPLTACGNDYRCNSPGGPPRPRPSGAGELFVLDLGPAYRGYYADNCRTFSVDGSANDSQQKAWATIVAVLDMVAQSVRPGVRCRELFQQAKTMLDEYRSGAFYHHLGHGFGLFPHEAPHLNPNWDDVFEEGDVFTAEPGLYGPELQAGIRLEENYLVTSDGVERLTSFPLDL